MVLVPLSDAIRAVNYILTDTLLTTNTICTFTDSWTNSLLDGFDQGIVHEIILESFI